VVMTRRWERAEKLGLNPPNDVKELLDSKPELDRESVWDQELK